MSARYSGPLLFCFCAPAASGKSTICRSLVETESLALSLSLSTTTRKPREGEVDGTHYFFVSREEFESRVAAGEFIEHAKFGSNRYGTEKRNIRNAESEGKDLILDIDVQGAEQLKALYGDRVVVIFVFPPSYQVLVERLEKRGSETKEQMDERLKIAQGEVKALRLPGFSDYLLINDELSYAIERATAILQAERQRLSRADDAFLKNLLDF